MKEIPEISLQRLPLYLNYLRMLPESEGEYVSSGKIAKALHLGEVLVRKDLAYTDIIGKPKVGYSKHELIAALEDYLLCNSKRNAVIVGIGGLGHALLAYNGFKNYGIDVVAGFDIDPEKIGAHVGGRPIYDQNDVETVLPTLGATLAIVCVPAHVAQSVGEKLIKAGVKGILNFAPALIQAPESVVVNNFDVAANLALLSVKI